MALDILTAAQGGTYALLKQCQVYTPDYHKNVTGLPEDLNAQIGTLTDSLPLMIGQTPGLEEDFCQLSKAITRANSLCH